MPINLKKYKKITIIGTPEDITDAIQHVISSEVSPKNKEFYIVKIIKTEIDTVKETK